MMKKMFTMTAVAAMAALSVQAQGSDELAALQKQLNELSAKIAQMEQSNNEKIAKLETDNSSKLAKIEADASKNKIPDWVNDTKFGGDFRYRYENIKSDTASQNQDRQRVRLRFGATGQVNDFVDYGVRVATGGASATSANQTIGSPDGTTKKEIMLDRYYVDIHPELFRGAHLIMGKMAQPWVNRTGLIWDDDLSPEGIAVTYANTSTNGFKLMANAGSFVLKDGANSSADMQLWAGQVSGETKVGGATVR